MQAYADGDYNKASKQIINVVLESIALMDVSYRWGGNTPSDGLDCSGFVQYVFKKALGINLPRTAAAMAQVGTTININNLQAGDLLFFKTEHNNNYRHISHIGIYLGDNQFIQSPHTGEQIQISLFSGYWKQHFVLAKRITASGPHTSNTNSQYYHS